MPAKDDPPEKNLKIHLPDTLRTKLHTLRILRGQSLKRTVREALEAYFATRS